jgi:quinohemoprotein amine dehydrogenase
VRAFTVSVPVVVFLTVTGSLRAQSGEAGIPVSDPQVIAKCGTCHKSDEHGNMERVSSARTTPEGWQAVLKNMILVNNMTLTPEEARPVLRYLSTANGLAPEEARPVMYDVERRIHEETNIPTDRLREACGRCHTFARSLSWRRSGAEWKLFVDAHATRFKVKPADAAEAITFLTRAAPLHSPEWDAWTRNPPGLTGLTGRWLVTATMPGRGQFFGEMQVDKTGEDELTTRVTLTSVKDGSKVTRSGKSAVYGGTAWRGRSKGMTPTNSSPDDPTSDAREAMWFASNQLEGEGRWFWGQYQEFGFNVKLQKLAAGPAPAAVLLLTDRLSLKVGTRGNRIRLIGENLPARVSAADVALGAGVTVRSVVSASPNEVVVLADVAGDAKPGTRDIRLGGSVLSGGIAIYDRIDYMKVTPESAVASFGDRGHPRGFQAFEASGYQRGPDGLSHTADDVYLGPVDVTWALQVFHAPDGSTPDYVGTMSPLGLLSPATTNPNVNFDTWVIATARDDKNPLGDPLVGKAYVVVTIPTYAFGGRQWVRDLDRWVDDGPALEAPRVQ